MAASYRDNKKHNAAIVRRKKNAYNLLKSQFIQQTHLNSSYKVIKCFMMPMEQRSVCMCTQKKMSFMAHCRHPFAEPGPKMQ